MSTKTAEADTDSPMVSNNETMCQRRGGKLESQNGAVVERPRGFQSTVNVRSLCNQWHS